MTVWFAALISVVCLCAIMYLIKTKQDDFSKYKLAVILLGLTSVASIGYILMSVIFVNAV